MPFSVVIPSFNDADCLPRAVESALSEPETAEVVVVDDGSDEDPAAVVASFADARVRLVRQENAGPAAARNSGIGAGTAPYVFFLDADDEIIGGSLAGMLEAHRSGALLVRAGAVIVASDVTGPAATGRTWLAEPSEHAYPRGAPLAGTFSVDRSALLRAGGYDPAFRFGENSEVLLRVAASVGADHIAYVCAPSVRRIERPGRESDFYVDRQISAARRMLDVHRDELRLDRSTRANHHAIISYLEHSRGHRTEALRHAVSAAVIQPGPSWRDWGRIVRCLGPRCRAT